MTPLKTYRLTAVYRKTGFSIYGAYIAEMPDYDAYGHTLNEAKEKLILRLNDWRKETGNEYILVDEVKLKV